MIDRQPKLPKTLVQAAGLTVAQLAKSMPHQDAAVLVHAGALAQHARLVGLVDPDQPFRSALADLSVLHPGLMQLAELEPGTEHESAIVKLWQGHQLMPLGNVAWWSYPLGDLYQTLSVESRKARALCQTPWWVTDLLIRTSYDRAQEIWEAPLVIDPSCGTGHVLVEAFHRAQGSHRFFDGYSAVAPYRTHSPSLLDALDRVHGVELDPYAATVARYRLLVMAWAKLRHRSHSPGACSPRCGEGQRGMLADLPVHVAAADSLLDDDEPLLQRDRYHVVLANPPYVTVKDRATNDAIRSRYPEVCNGTYSLALPFHALMMSLLVPGGWCAQLTASSFMKREFGKRYIEQWLPRFDAQWVIDTSGAYIPGHGTPTVILVHRNQVPSSDTVRCVQGVRGEPKAPDVPAEGLVWAAIREAVERRESADQFARGAESAWRLDHPEMSRGVPPVPSGPGVQGTLFDLLPAGRAA